MRADVVLLPSQLSPGQLSGRVVVVLDVLRATTTITAALAAGVKEIRIFPDTQTARAAAKASPGGLLCGEENCLKPQGFDLGNSPGKINRGYSGKTLFMSTTNGTRAILAARDAEKIFLGALVNATAVFWKLKQLGQDVVFLCAGTNGRVAVEDVTGAGAILSSLWRPPAVELESDAALLALDSFLPNCNNLSGALRLGEGGKNLIQAGLEEDIDYAAHLNLHDVVGTVAPGEPIKVVRETLVG